MHTSISPLCRPHHSASRHAVALLGGLLSLLAACGSTPSSTAARAVDPAPLRAFAARGYAAVEHSAVLTSTHAWVLAGQPEQVLLLRPERAGPLPVVVYLPGLGESAQAGTAWRNTWAAAGYAVLSVQTLTNDITAFQSDLAREGAFRALGQRHYAAAMVVRRAQALSAVLGEAQRRAAAGEAVWQGMAWDRVAVAGFELGAYTTLALAGEQLRGAEGVSASLGPAVKVRASIALSPHVDVSEGGLATRYRLLRGPLLSVTSDADQDPLGLVAGAAQRQAPFENAPAGDQFLLTLRGLAHARLNGSAAADAEGQRGRRSNDRGEGGEEAGARGRGGPSGGGSGGRRRGGGAGGGMEGAQSAASGRNPVAEPAAGYGLSPTAVQMRLIAAQDISTAFLDAYLRDDTLARGWLQNQAPRWLADGGELRHK